MSLPTMTGVGRLTGDPECRFSSSGTAVCTVNLAFNKRKRTESGEWVDDKVYFVRGVAFKDLAEHMSESLTRGMEVTVSGQLETQQWQDKQSGEKRSAPQLIIESIGPSLRFATAKVSKAERSGGQSVSGGGSWGSAPPSGDFSDEPPF